MAFSDIFTAYGILGDKFDLCLDIEVSDQGL